MASNKESFALLTVIFYKKERRLMHDRKGEAQVKLSALPLTCRPGQHQEIDSCNSWTNESPIRSDWE
jgi:hypothetical protein